MIRELVHKLIDTFLHNPNQFASGGLLLMAIGALGATLRKIPVQIWNWCAEQVTLSVTINDDGNAFYWLKHWFDTQRKMKKIRRVDIYNPNEEEYIFNPAPGGHWMWYRGRPIHITLTRNEEKKEKWSKRSESFLIRTLGRNQQFLRSFVDDIFKNFTAKKCTKPQLYRWGKNRYGDITWVESRPYDPRPIETVILVQHVKDDIIRDIVTFKQSRKWYVEMGIPYHRGYLFYGPPGTGKTSFVVGLSSYFQAKIYLLKLSEMTDDTLVDAISKIEANGMVVMEDVDCLKETQIRTEASKEKDDIGAILGKVTLSGLLNVIDGILAPSGVLFFMTTNHIEKLDPALIRPGRTDVKLFIGEADEFQKREFYKRFFPEEQIPNEVLTNTFTMAELQEYLLRKKNNI